MYNCEITNKFGAAVGAVLLIISAVLQLLIRFI
jgi:hypothetical protein